MRLIQTDGEGNITGEVKTFDPIAGIHDAVRIAAQHGGDGTYWADMQDGKYYEFRVENGQAHGLTEEGWRSGNPGDMLDDGEAVERVKRPASEFGGFFQDPDDKLDVPTANFLMPDTTAAVAAREAAEAEAQAAAAAQAAEAEGETVETTDGETAVGGEDETTADGEAEAEDTATEGDGGGEGETTEDAEGEASDGEDKEKADGETAEGADSAAAAE